MLMNRADTSGHGNLLPQIRRHAELNIEFYQRNRRFLRFVDTHQKWLLVHLISDTCGKPADGSGTTGAAANWICDRASDLGIASRNTSLAFFNQLAAYGYLSKKDCRGDRRIRLISLSESAETVMLDWTGIVVAAALGEDIYGLEKDCLRRIYREIATSLLADPKWLRPPVDVSLTQDMRGGWLVMSEILRHLPADASGDAWVQAPGLSIPRISKHFGLSRSTLYRLVRLSVEAGIMAWDEANALPALSINLYHLRQFCRHIGRLRETAARAYENHVTEEADVEALDLDLSRLDGMGFAPKQVIARPAL